MRAINEIQTDLDEARGRLSAVREELQAKRRLHAERNAGLDVVVQRVFLGEISAEDEARARQEESALAVEVDRMQRVVPLFEAPVTRLEEELRNAQWAEALVIDERAQQQLRELAEKICDEYEAIDRLGAEMRAVAEAAAPAFKLLNRVILPDELVAVARRARAR